MNAKRKDRKRFPHLLLYKKYVCVCVGPCLLQMHSSKFICYSFGCICRRTCLDCFFFFLFIELKSLRQCHENVFLFLQRRAREHDTTKQMNKTHILHILHYTYLHICMYIHISVSWHLQFIWIILRCFVHKYVDI